MLWPALRADAQPDPLFFLAGGPGQGAAQMGRGVREAFRRTQTNRDIVLVDQRGTGDSNPLDCKPEGDSLKSLNEPDQVGLDRLRVCLAGYDADPRLYTTIIAMDDLDDVRAYLGYDRINIYGGSYGTRAALVYLRQHADRVRSVVLDGVAPTDMRLPLFLARDAQRAMDRLLADCAADTRCAAQYPNLSERTRGLLARLQRDPAAVRLTHPRTGVAEDVTIDAAFVANIIVSALYSPLTSSLVPELIKRAEGNDFQGLLALGLAGESSSQNMSVGMQLSVICAEDYPRIRPEDIARESKSSIFGDYLLTSRLKACEFWPKGSVPSDYYEPVTSPVPVLLLSGDLDPVTPPTWGESTAAHLPNARHFIVPGTGHIALGTGCGGRIVRDFIERGSAADLNTGCLASLKRPPFFLSPAGPDPDWITRMIAVENLRKRFGTVTAVDGVTFTAKDGAVTGLLGPNGAGKTTTLRMLYALMRPDAGTIMVDDVDAVAEPQRAQSRLGVLPDVSGLYPRLTPREHIEYYGHLQGLSGDALRARTAALVSTLDMTKILDRRTQGFSHGERTKVALARALVHDPGNVLLDEPTNGLDVMSTRAVRDIIRRLRADGRCVLFSSHVMQEVSALCDSIIVISRGRVVASGTPDELREQTGHQSLEDAFVKLAGLEQGAFE